MQCAAWAPVCAPGFKTKTKTNERPERRQAADLLKVAELGLNRALSSPIPEGFGDAGAWSARAGVRGEEGACVSEILLQGPAGWLFCKEQRRF